eukprot:3937088-Rhodomonas_salina.1
MRSRPWTQRKTCGGECSRRRARWARVLSECGPATMSHKETAAKKRGSERSRLSRRGSDWQNSGIENRGRRSGPIAPSCGRQEGPAPGRRRSAFQGCGSGDERGQTSRTRRWHQTRVAQWHSLRFQHADGTRCAPPRREKLPGVATYGNDPSKSGC